MTADTVLTALVVILLVYWFRKASRIVHSNYDIVLMNALGAKVRLDERRAVENGRFKQHSGTMYTHKEWLKDAKLYLKYHQP